MGQFDSYFHIQVNMFDIATYGLVSVTMPHMGQLIDNAT